MVRRARNEGTLRPILTFLGRFAGAWAVALIALAVFPAVERWAVSATIASISLISHLFGIECSGTGSFMRLSGASLEIVSDCTSLMPTLALWAAMIAFPTTLAWRGSGMALGAATLWFYNVGRVLALAFVLQVRPAWFEFVHAYLWQTVTLALVFSLFVLWIRLRSADEAAP